MRMLLVLISVWIASSVPVTAQLGGSAGVRSGGAGWTATQDVVVTYVDGFRTKGSFYQPTGPLPLGTGRWPLIVFVHGLGGSHDGAGMHDTSVELAKDGYCVWAYSVRGQGASQEPCLNAWADFHWMTLWGGVETYDLAEQIHFALQTFPLADPDAIGVMGTSQGAIHCFKAAAFSGLPVYGPPGHEANNLPIDFPVIHAVVPFSMSTDGRDLVLRDGDWLGNVAAGLVIKMGLLSIINLECGDPLPLVSVLLDDIVWDVDDACGTSPTNLSYPLSVLNSLMFDTPEDLAPLWDAPGTCESRPMDAELAMSTVPIFYAHAYRDNAMSPWAGFRMVEGLSAPHRVHISTGGHGSPGNAYETSYRDVLSRRWFDHYLKGIANGVDADERYSFAAQPADEPTMGTGSPLWGHRVFDTWVPSPDSSQRLYLDGTSLAPVQPSTGAASLSHANFSSMMWLNAISGTQQGLLNRIPLLFAQTDAPDRVTFVSAPFDKEVELLGTIDAHLAVELDATVGGHFHLAATLWARPPASFGSEDVFLASWGERSGLLEAGDQVTVDMTLGLVSTVLPYDKALEEGTSLVLELSTMWGWTGNTTNTALAPIPTQAPFDDVVLQTIPTNGSFTFTVDFASGSYIDIPTLDSVNVALKTNRVTLPSASSAIVTLQIEAGQERANQSYRVLLSRNGHGPGTYTPLVGGPSIPVPLGADPLTAVADALAGGPPLDGFAGGVLDADGLATASFDFANFVAHPLVQAVTGGATPADFAGSRFTFVVLAPDTDATGVSNPLDLWIE